MLDTNSMGTVDLGIKIIMGPDDVKFAQKASKPQYLAQDQDDEISRL